MHDATHGIGCKCGHLHLHGIVAPAPRRKRSFSAAPTRAAANPAQERGPVAFLHVVLLQGGDIRASFVPVVPAALSQSMLGCSA